MRWKKSYPTQSHKISQIPQIMQDNFDVLEDTIIKEHSGSMTTASVSGMHSVVVTGLVQRDAALPGIMYEGPFTSLSALTPSAGGLAHDTTYGKVRLCSGGVWSVTQSGCVARAWASSGYNSESTLITANEVFDVNPAVQIQYDKNFDAPDEQTFDNFHDGVAMSAFDLSGTFTAPSSGMYIIIVGMTTVGSGVDTASAVCTADARATEAAFSWTTSAVGKSLASVAGLNVSAVNDLAWETPDDEKFNMWPGKRTSYDDIFTYTDTEAISSNLGENATSVAVTIVARARQVGCGCYEACYGEAGGCKACDGTHTCACNKSCYGYHDCTCNGSCYGYSSEGGGGEGGGGEGCGGDSCDSGCGGDGCSGEAGGPGSPGGGEGGY